MMKVGLNLYSIRNLIATEEDFLATAHKLREMGYDYLQYSGGEYDPARIARVSKEAGLPVYLTHVPMDRILNDTDALMAEHESFGCRNIGLGAMPHDILLDDEKFKQTVAALDAVAVKMEQRGFRFFYHHHQFEFMKRNGETLFDYIDAKGMDDVDCYKRANIDRKTFSKIKCSKTYKPSKVTVLSFAIALRLNLEETDHLLNTVGMSLSHSSKFDIIVEYFIRNEKYDINEINETLFMFDQLLLGC